MDFVLDCVWDGVVVCAEAVKAPTEEKTVSIPPANTTSIEPPPVGQPLAGAFL